MSKSSPLDTTSWGISFFVLFRSYLSIYRSIDSSFPKVYWKTSPKSNSSMQKKWLKFKKNMNVIHLDTFRHCILVSPTSNNILNTHYLTTVIINVSITRLFNSLIFFFFFFFIATTFRLIHSRSLSRSFFSKSIVAKKNKINDPNNVDDT